MTEKICSLHEKEMKWTCSACGVDLCNDCEPVAIGGQILCVDCDEEPSEQGEAFGPLEDVGPHYAGFRIRLYAYCIDLIVIFLIGMLVGLLLSSNKDLVFLLNTLIGPIYLIWTHKRTGQSLGKKYCHIRVVTKELTALTWTHCIWRYSVLLLIALFTYLIEQNIFKEMTSIQEYIQYFQTQEGRAMTYFMLIAMARYVWLFSDMYYLAQHPQKRSLHDLIGRTSVIYDA